jgi:hypothetical protein
MKIKIYRIRNNFFGLARDAAINQILISSGTNIGVQISNTGCPRFF